MTPGNSFSRRQVLQGTGALTAGALAGCLGFLPGSKPTAIKNITFQGDQFIVHLTDGTNADAIDFRSPSGELLHTASIGRRSSVTFSLFSDASKPYPPGTYTLVAVETSGEEPQTISKRSMKLASSFSVVDVRPLKDTPEVAYGATPPARAGRVQITLENTDTLPVGIKYIGFPKGVPSPDPPPSESSPMTANYRTVSDVGRFIPVDSRLTFESLGTPLLFYNRQDTPSTAVGVPKQGASWKQIKTNHCNGEQYTATLVVVPLRGSTHRVSVTFKYAGKASHKSGGATDYGCTNVTVVSMESKNASTTTTQ